MVSCETCGAENRDKARFCLGCARPLVAFAPQEVGRKPQRSDPFPPKSSVAPDRAPKTAQRAGPLGLWRWGLALALVVLALGLSVQQWSARADDAVVSAPVVEAPAAPASEPAPLAAATVLLEPATSPLALDERPITVEPSEPPKQVVERAAPREKKPDAKALLQRQIAEEARLAREAPPAPLPVPVAAPKPEAVAPPPVVINVEQACAQTANFLARDFCRIEACRNPAKASDPICVWYRKLEEERRNKVSF